ncbi:MAG: hypothetical protein JWQ94_199 [Tardiphaga sp.]|jgi:hypothetical protein|nr:hypothetical protein [Tardiphaga sp.]
MRIVGTSRISQPSQPTRRDRPAAPAAAAEIVAVSPPLRSAPVGYSLTRPDPFFIAQLLATAEQSPQTRTLRRADVSEVEAAYRAVANQNAAVTGVTRRIA